jgi:predicted transglutaminase-like protease
MWVFSFFLQLMSWKTSPLKGHLYHDRVKVSSMDIDNQEISGGLLCYDGNYGRILRKSTGSLFDDDIDHEDDTDHELSALKIAVEPPNPPPPNQIGDIDEYTTEPQPITIMKDVKLRRKLEIIESKLQNFKDFLAEVDKIIPSLNVDIKHPRQSDIVAARIRSKVRCPCSIFFH